MVLPSPIVPRPRLSRKLTAALAVGAVTLGIIVGSTVLGNGQASSVPLTCVQAVAKVHAKDAYACAPWKITPVGPTGPTGATSSTSSTMSTGTATSTASTTTTTTTTTAPPPVPLGVPGAWTLAFDDEFNGSALDTSKWVSTWGGSGSTMNGVSTSAANVSVSGGILSLTLSSSSVGALIDTDGFFSMGYGYIEAYINFPGSGSSCDDWPAFWTDGQIWPQDGEIDIAEGLGTLTSNYHSNSGANNGNTVPGSWCGSWHTYGVDREQGINTVYWDGVQVRSYTTDDLGVPEYIILNAGIGQGPTVIPDTVQVDYVRAWTH